MTRLLGTTVRHGRTSLADAEPGFFRDASNPHARRPFAVKKRIPYNGYYDKSFLYPLGAMIN